jgi:hypothetical protein
LQFLREETVDEPVDEPSEEDDRKKESGFEERGEGKEIMMLYVLNWDVLNWDVDFMRRGECLMWRCEEKNRTYPFLDSDA